MKCPICRINSLKEISLDTGLLARQCDQCFGHWLSSEQYWEWLESHQPTRSMDSPSTKPVPVSLNTHRGLLPVADNETAIFCADCARLMRKAQVGKGLSFYIDRCSYCHGVWLDQNEWDNLKTMNFHSQIHYVFSDAWQFSVRHEKANQHRVSNQGNKASA
ncbi:MAG: zf-TFIIB domain-containing protein [Phormidesmis sp.]